MWKKNFFPFIYDYYKTTYLLYVALNFTLIARSEVKLGNFLNR